MMMILAIILLFIIEHRLSRLKSDFNNLNNSMNEVSVQLQELRNITAAIKNIHPELWELKKITDAIYDVRDTVINVKEEIA